MNFQFHPEAETEFLAAIEWYAAQSTCLGADFAAEIHAAIRRAVAMPLAWASVAKDIHRVLAHRFPYGVLYTPREKSIYILAVMHLQREPEYWRERRQ
jgi:plasmid stabilization system protein ParE